MQSKRACDRTPIPLRPWVVGYAAGRKRVNSIWFQVKELRSGVANLHPRRHFGISFKNFAEGLPEFSEPRLERFPRFGSIAIDRLADLLGAGRAHRPVRKVKGKTFGLERQAAKIEQGPNFGLGVIDHPFINDAMDLARLHPIDVGHQPDIVAIVGRQVLEIVGKALAAGEVLLEVRKAAASKGIMITWPLLPSLLHA